nr:hypothetical protein [Bradyrhizobium cosmicum]QDP27019.1 hypothetical protein FNV92_34915 [Bradyrhizobium cosmicum]
MEIEQLVENAHRRLALRRLLIAIERNPDFLEAIDMNRTIKRAIELAGFAGRLNRAEKLENDLAVTGQRYDTVLADIDDQHAALKGHVGSLETTRAALDQVIGRMTASNGGPNDGSSEQGGSFGTFDGQVIDGKPV